MRRFVTIAVAVWAVVGLARESGAQALGVRAGVSGQPDQFYVGVHAETAPVFDRVRFRPNVELGVGDNQRLLALNLELVYRGAFRQHPWAVLVGGGPAANLVMFDRANGSDTVTRGGLNLLVGLEHTGGFFTELKVGLIDSPSIKFAIGYTFR